MTEPCFRSSSVALLLIHKTYSPEKVRAPESRFGDNARHGDTFEGHCGEKQ